MDNQLWRVYTGRPWGSLATVSAPEVGRIPGCGLPSYGEMVSDGPGLLDARRLPVVLGAQDDVGTPGGGIRDLGRSDLPPSDCGVPCGPYPSLAGMFAKNKSLS